MAEMVKVVFELEPDEYGWPPATAEGLWAHDLGEGRYRIDNVPWFTREVSDGDVVSAEPRDDGQLWFAGALERSGHATFRLMVSEQDDVKAVRDELRAEGIDSELHGLRLPQLISLDVPPSIDLGELHQRLEDGERSGRWEWEEGYVPDERLWSP